ncbi:hypothetical protein AN958_03424 [Leucoagaricus sp. SymC.cos]|nr:hypothetical protein AN958_03424 [Leucoagaricus sp. SymC.cos]
MCQSSSTTITTLPPELLGEIFVHCALDEPDSPAMLATLSHRFHKVALSTPQAWQWLTLSLSEYPRQVCSRKTHLWFARSAECAINVKVNLIPSSTYMHQIPNESSGTYLGISESLKPFFSRIHSLNVDATSENIAQYFISNVYSSSSNTALPIPLEGLVLRINSDFPTTLLPSIPASTLIPFPILPRLSHLQLVNHSLPNQGATDLSGLKILSIIRPVRAPPLTIMNVLRVLCHCRSLTSFTFEGRMIEGPMAPHQNEDEQPEEELSTPLTLPAITQFSLRSNRIPQLLSALILPELRILTINDLDGRRPNASEETGTMLRQLLVRMELPRETRKSDGLRILELRGVTIRRQYSVWEWCFRRMWNLEVLGLKDTNVDEAVGILLSSIHSDVPVAEGTRREEIVCPRLHTLSVTGELPSGSLKMFESCRPATRVVQEIRKEGSDLGLDLEPRGNWPALVDLSSPVTGSGGFGFGSSFDRQRKTIGQEGNSDSDSKSSGL